MTGAEFQQHVATFFRSQAGRFQLDTGTLKAERVLNWGGFVSHSYQVGDGVRSTHVKLATDQTDMRRWLAVHGRLERGDTPHGLKPGGFSGLLPSNLRGARTTTWLAPGYLEWDKPTRTN